MKEITSVEEFDQEIQADGVTVVKFWASWCGPCKAFSPTVETVEEQVGPAVKFLNVSIEDLPELSSRFQVRTIPMLLFMKGGELVDQQIGTVPAHLIREKIEAHQ